MVDAEIAKFEKGQLTKTIEKWGPEYRIEFHMKIKSSPFLPNIYHNLFRLAAYGHQSCSPSAYKCRVPGVWIYGGRNGDLPRMHTSVAQIPCINAKFFDFKMKFDQWYNIVLDHTVDTNEIGKFSLYVDCKKVWEISGTAATAYDNVAVYQSEIDTLSAGRYVYVRGLRFLNYA